MRFTSFTAVLMAFVAFGSTSILAHGTHEKPSSSQEAAVTVLRRYMDETGYTAREVMDQYELFRRTTSSKLGRIAKHAINNADNLQTLANAFRTLKPAKGSSVDPSTGTTEDL